MDAIYADYSISMSEFKKNPAQVFAWLEKCLLLCRTLTGLPFMW